MKDIFLFLLFPFTIIMITFFAKRKKIMSIYQNGDNQLKFVSTNVEHPVQGFDTTIQEETAKVHVKPKIDKTLYNTVTKDSYEKKSLPKLEDTNLGMLIIAIAVILAAAGIAWLIAQL